MNNKVYKRTLFLLLILTIVAAMIAISWGTYWIPLSEIPKILIGQGTKLQNTAVFLIRMPRILVAAVVGIALATAGCILQTTTKNDLADSGIIGINAGAALFVVLLITSSGSNYYEDLGGFSLFLMPLAAMAGALMAAVLVYSLAAKGGLKPQRLILVGIGVNAGLNAIVTFLQLKSSSGDYNRVLVFTAGSLWGSSWKYFYMVAPIIILIFMLIIYKHKVLDLLALGDEVSIGLGVDCNKERKKFLFYAVVLAGCATAVAGNIAFLGLLAPHMARKLVGCTHKRCIPVAACISVCIIVLADSLSRNLFSPLEIPVGITISLLGVPYFIYLMFREDRS